MAGTLLRGGLAPLAVSVPVRAERLNTTGANNRGRAVGHRRPGDCWISPAPSRLINSLTQRRRTTTRCPSAGKEGLVEERPQVEVSEASASRPSVQPVKEMSAERQAEIRAFQKLRLRRRKQIKREQLTYQICAIAATSLMAFLAVFATYHRFIFLRKGVSNFFPWWEFAATLLLVFGGVAAMEAYARFAHKILWHDFKPGWELHKSHHEPRTGPFEANDIYAVANAIPAISLCAYGFVTTGLLGGLSFGLGMGITIFGIMYMFVHDGLVHKRFPVGPIAKMPYLRKIAAAHQLHHSEKYEGVPWGMFLGLQELEKYPGAIAEVNRMVAAMDRSERKQLKERLRRVKLSNDPPGQASPLPLPA